MAQQSYALAMFMTLCCFGENVMNDSYGYPFHMITHLPPPPDHYDILGIDPHAGEDDIKAAFKRRAKEVHPDISTEVKGHTCLQLFV